MRRRLAIGMLAAALAAAGLAGAAAWWMGGSIGAPVPATLGPPPPGYAALRLASGSGAELRGWLAEPRPGAPAVLLLHPFRSNRRSMLGRAEFLRAAGYAVLLIDFQAHGESTGERMSFGHLEARDARAALERLRAGGRRVAALGTSLGGAAVLLAEPPLDLDALVVEAVYPTIEEAVRNRLEVRLGRLGRPFAPLLAAQIRPRLGIPASRLRPIEGVRNLRAPLLLVAGTRDRRTPLAESRRLFAEAPEPKQLWEIEGARHQDFHRFAGPEYERRILGFLAPHLEPR